MGPLSIFLIVWGLAAFGGAWWAYHHRRAIADTPTSKVRSIAVGHVELEGTAAVPPTAEHLRGPFTDEPCVYWQYQIAEERKHVTQKGIEKHWTNVASGYSRAPIALKDDTGIIVIDHVGTDVPTPVETIIRTGYGNDPSPRAMELLASKGISTEGPLGHKPLRFTERRLMEGTPLFVLGEATRADGATAAGHAALVVKKGSGTFLISVGSEKGELTSWTLMFWTLLLFGIAVATGGVYLGVR